MINSDLDQDVKAWNQFASAALTKLLPEIPIPIPENGIAAAKEHIQTITRIAAWTADLMMEHCHKRTDLQRFKRNWTVQNDVQ